MANLEAQTGRRGIILRVLPHGTVIVWDTDRRRSYPYYKAGKDIFRLEEQVTFVTDPSDTVVLRVDRTGNSGDRKVKTEEVVLQREERVHHLA